MIVTEAFWERRNLGLKVFEVEISDISDFKALKELPKCDYISVKIAVGMPCLIKQLLSLDYIFAETLSYVYVVRLPVLGGVQLRMERLIHSRTANASERKTIESYIDAGLFGTDRFSLDPVFTLQQSANRYKGWIGDVLDDNGELHSIIFQENCVGFFLISKESGGLFKSILAGIFSDIAPPGLGALINFVAYKYCFANGAKKVHSVFSSNNIEAVSIHAGLETRLLHQHYVFVKHNVSLEGR